ncbi:phosphatase PAP2 family protein [Candidatus Poribacteria bacterium]|jgi:undecaprenyl-diphosphatase|nr:phosphatase PAP2 family protein [Candidatus Poribacteria bacterium]MBT5535920.1 phosphatase PAP2 family protein [Candidatus Poribacteria bacterium]MBT5714528.1 phosphatase PAP2 family protein [Candidatus Poribacteria bacterium]MBT7101611.1 phosphatase PAP2 family protein [Candidatus Poribacteria bacterium]MBT7807270.1 phosphatase PAP2 family protein [Candidatus Poribacteria bacterium]
MVSDRCLLRVPTPPAVLGGVALCVAMWILAVSGAQADGLDTRLYRLVREDAQTSALDRAMPVVTEFGAGYNIIGLALLGVALGSDDQRRTGVLALSSVLASGAVTATLKDAVGRSRPDGTNDHRSMPSGHTTGAFALATALSHRYPEWRLPFYLGAVGVAVSRVYLGRHYPSDVLAGAVIGTSVSRLVLTQDAAILSFAF